MRLSHASTDTSAPESFRNFGLPIGLCVRFLQTVWRLCSWRLLATKLDIRGALYGERPQPSDEIWLRDSDIVVVPQHPILQMDNFIDLVFTRGIYAVFPVTYTIDGFTRL